MASTRKSIWFVCLFTTAVLCTPSLAQIGTYSIPAGNGTLTYSYNATAHTCISDERRATWYSTRYYNFSYTINGTTVPLEGTDNAIFGLPKTYYGCQNSSSEPPVALYVAPVFPYSIQTVITFTPLPDWGGEAVLGSLTPGIIYPKYQVQSIIYDPPGNHSSNGFQNTETDGTSTSVGSSFGSGQSVTYSFGTSFMGVGSTISWTVGNSTTTGNSTQVTQTVSDALGVSIASNPSSPNAINHQQDLFIIWVNPAVVVYQTGATSVAYAQGTQLQTAGDPKPGQPEGYQRQVEVIAQQMMPNAKGLTTVDIEDLEPYTTPDNEVLPGLAGICANQAYYPAHCSEDPNGQCGCTPNDFTAILAQDPVLSYGPTESPLNADTSGAAACGPCASSTASCRYVAVPSGLNSCLPLVETLKGPANPGGVIPQNPFTATDQNSTTTTLSEMQSLTVSSSQDQQFMPFGTGVSLRETNTWTWTDSESFGKINMNAHSMSVNFASGTVACDQEVGVFEDTRYHTFVFQQPPGDTSCP
jgi:hypothetical protein